MKKRLKTFILGSALSLGLGGCMGIGTSPAPTPAAPVNADPNYQAGYQDGCATAHGEYKKDSKLFNADKNYYDGWFAGRSACHSNS